MKTMLLNRVLTYQLVLKTNFLGNIGPRPFLTECQYSPVWLEKVRLLNSLLYGTQSTHIYFEFSGVSNKFTRLMNVSTETVILAEYGPCMNSSERLDLPQDNLAI